LGALIGGGILTVLLLILAGTSLVGQSADVGSDLEDLSPGELESGDIEADTEIGSDVETTAELAETNSVDDISDTPESDLGESGAISDIEALNTGLIGHAGEFVTSENSTPLSLVFSLYLLWFGAIGVFTYKSLDNKFIWLALIILIPIILTKSVSLLWKRVTKNSFYRVPLGRQLIGKPVVVKIDVTEKNGTISLRTADSVQILHAKSLYPLSRFYSGETVYICDYKDGIYLVDANPRSK
jgi:membrane protein implicated in regulation of membrane protease activity